MQIQYVCPMWGMNRPTLRENLEAIKAAGFDGVETWAPGDQHGRQELRALLDELNLALISAQWTFGNTVDEHIASFEEQFLRNIELAPAFVNTHTGVDHYAMPDNLKIIDHANTLADRHGVTVLYETHRGRPTFSAPATMALLDARPELKLTADFSHWCCVHESLLKDQAERVQRACAAAHYIHARVGHAQGPQVTHPLAPEWQDALDTHLGWWQQIVDLHVAAGTEVFYICTEFGPPDYMVQLPFTRMPVADPWRINISMMKLLKQKLVA